MRGKNHVTIVCTGCDGRFQNWHAWRAHRIVVPPEEREQHGGHSTRCFTQNEWIQQMLALLEQQQQMTQEEGEKTH